MILQWKYYNQMHLVYFSIKKTKQIIYQSCCKKKWNIFFHYNLYSSKYICSKGNIIKVKVKSAEASTYPDCNSPSTIPGKKEEKEELKILCLSQITVKRISYCLYIKDQRGLLNICQLKVSIAVELSVCQKVKMLSSNYSIAVLFYVSSQPDNSILLISFTFLNFVHFCQLIKSKHNKNETSFISSLIYPKHFFKLWCLNVYSLLKTKCCRIRFCCKYSCSCLGIGFHKNKLNFMTHFICKLAQPALMEGGRWTSSQLVSILLPLTGFLPLLGLSISPIKLPCQMKKRFPEQDAVTTGLWQTEKKIYYGLLMTLSFFLALSH